MRRTRAVFKVKLALRYSSYHLEQLKADACAESLFDKDPPKFWNSMYKLSNSKASCHISSIGGACGAENVADMWKTHFQELYIDTTDNKYRKIFFGHNKHGPKILEVHCPFWRRANGIPI